MVLYKRKQVTFVRPPSIPSDPNTEIYIIPQTKEWFVEYEDYLVRMDYYYRRKFVCEITGNSCLTFFEAYDSEQKEIKDVEKNFPEALREHILRFLQFNRITRLDQLVDKVYLVFKNDYFPGEDVYVKKAIFTNSADQPGQGADDRAPTYMSTIKQRGVIREKVQYSNPSDTKYLVSTVNEGQQIIATNQQIARDRNHFTKWLIKTFVKLTVTRSHKVGAPWVVKEKYAKKYRIPQAYPEAVKHFESSTPSGEILYEDDPSQQSPDPSSETPEPVKGKKQRGGSLKKKATLKAAAAAGALEIKLEENGNGKPINKNDPRQRFALHHLPEAVLKELEANDQATLSSFQPSKKTIVDDLQLDFDLQNSKPVPSELELPENAKQLNETALEAVEKTDSESDVKNEADITNGLKPIADVSVLDEEIAELKSQKLNSVQEALECWAFLNIYHSVLKLDTFTFDDFIIAMSWNAEQYNNLGRCELLDEIWCAALSGLVSSELPGKKYDPDSDEVFGLRINLPSEVSLVDEPTKGKDDDMNDERGSDSEHESKTLKSEDEASENESMTETVSPQNRPSKIKTDTLSGDEKDEADEDHEASESEEEDNSEHLAYSVMNYRGVKWHDRLRKRNFKDGNWQTILLGVLSMVEYVSHFEPTIQKIYKTLAPLLQSPATPTTVLTEFYHSMGIDLRLKALHIVTSLLVNGTLVRNYIDESLEASITLRRTRLDTIRDLKSAVDAANKVHSSVHEALLEAANSTQDQSEWSHFNKKKTRLNIKGYEMTDVEKLLAESNSEFQKLWTERDNAIGKVKELREAKKDVEMKLTELDCQRVRLLGKDRFYNRYWWFENNGLPNLHFVRQDEDEEDAEPETNDVDDDKDEVLEETYLMGKLWVQGPTGIDVLINLKLDDIRALEFQRVLNRELTTGINGNGQADAEDSEEVHDLGDGGTPLKVMNFRSLPPAFIAEAEKFDVHFQEHTISVGNTTEVIDRVGGIPKEFQCGELEPMQRKLIEEAPEPLVSGTQWRYYDQTEDIDRLIKWLNPWGKRESVLRKEVIRVKEGMVASIAARRKALWLSKLPKEETAIETDIVAVNTKIEELKSQNVVSTETEESEDDSIVRKRPNRRTANTPNKRQKTTEETIKTGSLEDLDKLQDQLRDNLANKVAENQVNRVLEWVNSTAQNEFDKSIYDGGDKIRTKGRKPKK